MTLASLLRRLWRRPLSPPVTHTLVCGVSRSGKSEAELSRLIPLARANECAIVLLDPPGTLAAKFLLHLDAAGLTDRVLYDRLADTDRVPGYDWLAPSLNPDPLQRQAENDERVREFASVLLRRRGIQDPALTPLIEEWLLAALELYLCQDQQVPLPWLADVFDLHSERRAHLLAHCTGPRLVRKFEEHARLSPTARRNETGPAQRILRAVLGSPAFRIRCGATFDFDAFLDEQGILILDGSSRGNLSRDAAAVMMGAVILRVIQHCRTGNRRRVILVLDEAVTAGLIGLHESQALSEAGKWGLEFHILVQNPFNFPSREIQGNVLQNCWRHEWFRQGSPEAARLAAEDVAIPLLNPLKVHHKEEFLRSADAGYRLIQTARGAVRSTVLWPRRTEILEERERYTALTDQILLLQKELMLLKPGYRFVRCDRVTAVPEYVPMLRETRPAPEGISSMQRSEYSTEDMIRNALVRVKGMAAFRAPAVSVPKSPPSHTARAAARVLADRGVGDRRS